MYSKFIFNFFHFYGSNEHKENSSSRLNLKKNRTRNVATFRGEVLIYLSGEAKHHQHRVVDAGWWRWLCGFGECCGKSRGE